MEIYMENLKTLIIDNQERLREINIIKRDIVFDISTVLDLRKIITIYGPRRAGKTCFMIQVMKELNLNPEETVFIDFSEIVLTDFSVEDFQLLYTAYCELYPDKTPWFFFDEIQEVNSFEKGLKYLLNRGCRIFITGSSVKLFSKDIASILRGKTLMVKVPTLNFKEYLKFRDIDIPEGISLKKRGKLIHELETFLYWGGFPEIVLSHNSETKRNLIKSYIDIMLFRDIIEKYSIKNSYLVELFFVRLIKSFTKEISMNKCYNDFRSSGLKISKETLFQYLKYFEDSQYIHLIENRTGGATSLKKVFLEDNGLYTPIYSFSPDKGKLLENLLLKDLCRMEKQPFFLRFHGKETDFIVDNTAIQVSHTLTDDNSDRELKGLKNALKLDYIQDGLLIVINDNRKIKKNVSLPDNCRIIHYLEYIL